MPLTLNISERNLVLLVSYHFYTCTITIWSTVIITVAVIISVTNTKHLQCNSPRNTLCSGKSGTLDFSCESVPESNLQNQSTFADIITENHHLLPEHGVQV